MSSEHAFNHVKALLGKLDRSIDEARARRIGDADEEQAEGQGDQGGQDRQLPGRHAPERAEGTGSSRFASADPSVGGSPNHPGGAHQDNGTGTASGRRPTSHQPLGASPTNSNPTRRPGIGRARPLTRTDNDAEPETQKPDDDWVGGSGPEPQN